MLYQLSYFRRSRDYSRGSLGGLLGFVRIWVKVPDDVVDKKIATKFWECVSVTENSEQTSVKTVPMPFAETEDERPWPKITLLGLLIVLGMLGLLAALIVPSFLRSQAQGRWSACAKGGLHNIAVALEMYASDHDGRYPNELSQLTPDYLVEIPVCPENEAGTCLALPLWMQGRCNPS